MDTEQPKVFVSYNRADRNWAEWIAGVIESAGYEPIIDAWHFRPGENFVLRMQEASTQAKVTIAVLSETYLQAAYTQPEWAAAFVQDPTGTGRRLIPVRVGKCALTGMLAPIIYIDLVGLCEEEAKRALLDGLGPKGQPAHPPVFPGTQAQSSVSTSSFPPSVARPDGAPAPDVLLPPPPLNFVGRDEILKKLYAVLAEKPYSYSYSTALLYGEPGCGKSTLALKFAWLMQGVFDAVVFQYCGQRPVEAIAAELAAKLELGVENRPPHEQIDAAQAWLLRRPSLLVLDDIWEDDLKALVALGAYPQVSVLCTSRRRFLPGVSVANSLELKSFSRDEAESIFHIYLGEETIQKHRASLLEFAENVECLPIAIVVGADMLRRELDPVPEATNRIRLELLRDVATLLRRAIAARPEQQRRLLNAMAVCSPDGFWFPVTAQIAGLNDAEGRDARNELVNASLLRMLDRDRQRFQLHSLLREQLRSEAQVGELQAAHAKALETMFCDWERRWAECRECLPEVISAVQHLSQQKARNRAKRLSHLGFATGRRVGEFEIALRIAQEETALCLELGDKDGLQWAYGSEGVIRKTWGQSQVAMRRFEQQEALCLELGNKNGLQWAYGNRAMILQANRSSLKEAMALQKKAEALCLELGDKGALQATYGNQGLILQTWDRLEEAMVLLKKQEELCLELGDKDGLQTTYGNQALILQTWGRLEEAMVLLKKQEELCLELGNKKGLAYCYCILSLIARKQSNRNTEREKLTAALNIFTELNMVRERREVREELDKLARYGAKILAAFPLEIQSRVLGSLHIDSSLGQDAR